VGGGGGGSAGVGGCESHKIVDGVGLGGVGWGGESNVGAAEGGSVAL